MPKTPIRVVDLFSGCGGLSYGFENYTDQSGTTPYVTVLGVDNWEPALKVFNANTPAPASAVLPAGRRADMEWFDHPSEVLLYYLVHYANVFADRKLGGELASLGVGSFLETPDGSLDASLLLEELIDSLECDELHYAISHRIVKAKEHGIPQARERFIMCGVNSAKGSPADLESVLSIPSYKDEVVLGHALQGLPKPREFVQGSKDVTTSTRVEVQEVSAKHHLPGLAAYIRWIGHNRTPTVRKTVDGHIVRKAREDDARLYKFFPTGTRWMDMKTPNAKSLRLLRETMQSLLVQLPHAESTSKLRATAIAAMDLLSDSLALRLYLEEMSATLPEEHHLLAGSYLSNGTGSHGDWFERLALDKPCKTIVAHIGKDTYGYIHPFEPRPISIREAARIQTFPDAFSFSGVGVVDAYSMIGNAVPPLLANYLAENLWRLAAPWAKALRNPETLIKPASNLPAKLPAMSTPSSSDVSWVSNSL